MSVNMFSQRALQTSMRRLALARPTTTTMRMISPAAIATGQIRPATSGPHANTVSVSSDEAYKLLAEQRVHRPVSPHLGIYQPQVTWYLSALNRITGSILSGSFYLFGFAYLVAPAFGWHLESASIAAAFASWPIVVKLLVKGTMAFPLAFHSLNGLRHLTWDMGAVLTNRQVQVTGWAIVVLSSISGLYLMFS
ncbi:cytochrome b subunit of succinate dehydrogenase, Sdh3p [Neophaeococcomyces mojaviensis]|uniref:Cytochrome b subunit of succinate dehydrogenase, Sdh3p n=1 Tax=Neophaeococcomyces mojaviensis TaxID=3383035 RepID=A0ACC3AJD3_9EURO|nr:cytochrome b subunit of succinate dehydrogenase, Sdh3p [Knufia sp. JES_112]